MSYQTFPWIKGDSASFEKLQALQIPNLNNKSFLDIGCNEGFFCGYAKFAGARKVTGIDNNPAFLKIAQTLFPECEFICQHWDDLGNEKYDVILNSSAIHYAADPKKFIDLLMSRLTPNGVLILELGIAPGNRNEFVKVTRSIDERYFPTRPKALEMFAGYAHKFIGRSVQQAGDPVPRYVYHLSPMLPYAILLLDNSYAGKTTTATHIFNPSIPIISGDTLYKEVMAKQREVPAPLSVIFNAVGGFRDWSQVTYRICKHNLFGVLCDWITEIAGYRNFILEMFILKSFRLEMSRYLEKRGYYVVNVSLQKAVSWQRNGESPLINGTEKYREYLEKEFMINIQDYLAANPDVEKAWREGKIASPLAHFIFHGRNEGRKRSPETD